MQTTEIISEMKWAVDTMNSQIGFKVKYLLLANVRGNFKEFGGIIYASGEEFMNTRIDFLANAASIDTGNETRDKHLKSEDFFDVERFKEIRFTASHAAGFSKTGNNELQGELSMKAIKKTVRLDVQFGGIIKDPWGTDKAIFKISGKINRKEWGLNWNAVLETGGVLVGEDVWISCEVLIAKEP